MEILFSVRCFDRLRRGLWVWHGVWIAVPVATIVTLTLWWLGWLRLLEVLAWDVIALLHHRLQTGWQGASPELELVLAGSYLPRTMPWGLRRLLPTEEVLWVLGWSLASGLASWRQRYSGLQQRESMPLAGRIWDVVQGTIASGLLLGMGFVSVGWGWWLPIVPAWLAMTMTLMGIDLYLDLRSLLEQAAYNRLLPKQLAKVLQKTSLAEVKPGHYVHQEMAVMFSDLRSFSRLSETMTPQENFKFVSSYLGRVSPAVRSHRGLIVKFLGDGMMAVFPEGVVDAVEAGLAKLAQVEQYNGDRANCGYEPVQLGIGIHFGPMTFGLVGETERLQGDAFSDDVNLTARLEGLTKGYGVPLLLSGQAVERLGNHHNYTLRFLAYIPQVDKIGKNGVKGEERSSRNGEPSTGRESRPSGISGGDCG